MAILKQEKGRLIRQFDDETLWVEPWGADSLRIRCTRNFTMNESQDWALLPNPATDHTHITIDGNAATLVNGKITVKIEDNGKISFYRTGGKLLLQEFMRTEDSHGQYHSLLKIYPRELKPILGGDYSLTQRFESNPKEKLYGMGQYQQKVLNLKGATLELAQRNSQASVPFLVSDQGYGFLWNNPAIGRATLSTNITEWSAHSTKQLDYWITAGDSPAEIVTSYGKASGTPPMMPDFAMGFWQSKLRYQTQDELMEVAREYKRRNIPLSVIVCDYFHWPNQGTWDFDTEYWPDPQAMVDELKEMGVELMVSVWPTVDSTCENYSEMLEKGYLTRTDRGVRTQMQMLGNMAFYDATNPGARKYVWDKVKKHYFDLGIKVFWLDVAEPEYSTYDFDNYRYSMGSNLQVGNIYPVTYAKGFYDGLISEGIQQPISLLRCAWAGSQRYGALVWSGDVNSTFESMQFQVVAGLNMAMAGIPWWTTDIGGFNNGNPDDPAFQELMIRWFQYGAFCPVMRLHGYRLPHSEPLSSEIGGGMCDSGAGNEVWSFGDKAYPILKEHIELRYRLKPYITDLMERCSLDGTPPMRPTFYDFPNDENTWEIDDQFMFGPNLLVSPVMQAGATNRKVYLPSGTEWIDVYSGEKLQGGQFVEAEAPLHRIPVFTNSPAMLKYFKK